MAWEFVFVRLYGRVAIHSFSFIDMEMHEGRVLVMVLTNRCYIWRLMRLVVPGKGNDGTASHTVCRCKLICYQQYGENTYLIVSKRETTSNRLFQEILLFPVSAHLDTPLQVTRHCTERERRREKKRESGGEGKEVKCTA